MRVRRVFLTFADTDFIERARPKNDGRSILSRIEGEVAATHLFDARFILDEASLKTWPHLAKAKGARLFYWGGWKPYLILKIFEMLRDGDLLVYSDAGNTIGVHGWDRLFRMATMTGFVGWEDSHLESHYTKADLLKWFDVDPSSPQLWSGAFVTRRSAETTDLMMRWLDYFDNAHFVDDTPSTKLEEDPNFVEHRHDQSCLSLLVKSAGYPRLPHAENFEADAPIRCTRLR